MTYDRKEHYKLKNGLELQIYRIMDTQMQLMEKLGLRETQERDAAKLTFKHSTINKRDTNLI